MLLAVEKEEYCYSDCYSASSKDEGTVSHFVSFHHLLPVFPLSGCSHCMEKLNVSKRMLHSAEQTYVGLVFEWLNHQFQKT